MKSKRDIILELNRQGLTGTQIAKSQTVLWFGQQYRAPGNLH